MKFTKFGHACQLIEAADARILIDPGAFSKGFEDLENLSAIFITHQHPDHLVPENLAALAHKNPGLTVYADEESAQQLGAPDGYAVVAVRDGDQFEVAGVKVHGVGLKHAVIHPQIPGIANVGYVIAERFFYPGDNFTSLPAGVEVLALPLGAPWLKVSEVVDYVLAQKPKVVIPVHDAVLAMPGMHQGILRRFTEPAGIELRVVENGDTTEI